MQDLAQDKMDGSFMVCRSPLTHWYLRCLKWSMQGAQPSSHRFGRLDQAERSDSHMVDPMLHYIALSLSLSSNTGRTVRRWAWCLLTVSHPLTQEGHQRKLRDFVKLNIISMQIHSWPKQSGSEQPVFPKHLQFKTQSLKHLFSSVEFILAGGA